MSDKGRRTRCDAVANRTRILDAAAGLIARAGAQVPLEEIARRAGIGIATLYRHFPNRPLLLHAVAVDLLSATTAAAAAARATEPDAFTALARYLHTALDRDIGAVLPALAALGPDAEVAAVRASASDAIQALVAAAHLDGSLRTDVSAADIGMLVLRCARPLPGAAGPSAALGHRHLDLFLDGLRTTSCPAG